MEKTQDENSISTSVEFSQTQRQFQVAIVHIKRNFKNLNLITEILEKYAFALTDSILEKGPNMWHQLSANFITLWFHHVGGFQQLNEHES